MVVRRDDDVDDIGRRKTLRRFDGGGDADGSLSLCHGHTMSSFHGAAQRGSKQGAGRYYGQHQAEVGRLSDPAGSRTRISP